MADTTIAEAGAYYRAGELDAAADRALALVARVPDHFDALHLLGVICQQRDQWADAAAFLARAARIQPNNQRLRVNQANTWISLEQFDRAEDAARRVLAANPGDTTALNNLGLAYAKQGRHDEAIAVFRDVLSRDHNDVVALFNMGHSLEATDRLEDAVAAYRAALPHVSPGRLMSLLRALGAALVAVDRPEEALALFESMQAAPVDLRDLDSRLCLLHLQLGDYRAGWREYEARWRSTGRDRPHARATIPDIAKVANRRVLVVGEQGRGDIIQVARYVPMLAALGAEVYLSVYDDLKTLAATLPGIAGVIGEDELEPECDFVVQLMSLPHVFATTVDSIPAETPYLWAAPDRVAAWKTRLVPEKARHIGIAWDSTNPGVARTTRLARLRSILCCPGAIFHCLQKEIADEDLEIMRSDGLIRDHRAALTDFAETAALIAALDLTITIDTSVAHLAGALGKPVWIMLPHAAEWRWLRHRSDSPWYPSARLFRQSTRGDWEGLAARIAGELVEATI